MKRRHFFSSLTWSIAGLGLTTSCLNTREKDPSQQTAAEDIQSTDRAPSYREKIKTSFSTGDAKGANDRIVLALIGAGSWGTNLILTVAGINKNVLVKYVCDVDDTRGGRAINELGKMQKVRPVRVRDMR